MKAYFKSLLDFPNPKFLKFKFLCLFFFCYFLYVDEFKRAAYVATGVKLSPHLVNTVFKIFDVDRDDQLSYKEFIGIMKDRLNRGFRVRILIFVITFIDFTTYCYLLCDLKHQYVANQMFICLNIC